MTQAGSLRERITIQQDVGIEDTSGERSHSWQDFHSCWAAVQDLSGREYFEANQSQSEISTQVRIRHKAGIRPQMRILWGSRIFEIVSVANPMAKNAELVILCSELVK